MFKKMTTVLMVLVLFLVLILQYQSGRIIDFKRETQRKFDLVNYRINQLKIGDSVDKNTFDFNVENHMKLDGYQTGINKKFQSIKGLNQSIEKLKIEIEQNSLLIRRMQKIAGYNVYVAQTKQNVQAVDDAYIRNTEEGIGRNTGRSARLIVGHHDNNETLAYRALIRFKTLQNFLPKGAKILSAKLYMKNYNHDHNHNTFNEVIYLHAVKKDWDSGKMLDATPSFTGVTWKDARVNELAWSTPGLWSDKKDVDSTILASSQAIQRSKDEQWIVFYFTDEGISHIERVMSGGVNYGWLLRHASQGKSNAFMNFYSSDSENSANRPYLEITYAVKQGAESSFQRIPDISLTK